MIDIINSFNQSWSYVQIIMLVSLSAMTVLPVYFISRIFTRRLPRNTLLALIDEGDRLIVSQRKDTPFSNQQIADILDLTSAGKGWTDSKPN